MKKDLQNLARKNGRSAKVKAGRVAIMLKLYQDDPRARAWLRFEAARLAKSVSYHLRQASILGGVINQMEHGDRPALATEQAGTPGGCPYRTVSDAYVDDPRQRPFRGAGL